MIARFVTPGLDGHTPVRDVDVEDAIQPAQRDDHAAGDGQRAAGQARAVPPRDERQALAMAEPHDRLHRLGGRRHDDERRRFAKICERVALVGEERGRLVQHGVRTTDPFELSDLSLIHGRIASISQRFAAGSLCAILSATSCRPISSRSRAGTS